MKSIISQFFGVVMMFVAMVINNMAWGHSLSYEEQYMASHGWFITNLPSRGVVELKCANKSLDFVNVKAYRIDRDYIYISHRGKNSYTKVKNANCMVIDQSYKYTNLSAYNFLESNSAMKNSLRKMSTINPRYCENPSHFLRSIYPRETVEYYYANMRYNQVLVMVASERIVLRVVNACR